MPNISFYATSKDLEIIVEHLNQDQEIAYLIPDGKNRWKAVSKVSSLQPGLTQLWHVPAGELFYKEGSSDELHRILDPWSGWEMSKSIEMMGLAPWFPAEVAIKIYGVQFRPYRGNTNEIGLSSIGWLGNHYSTIGIKAKVETEKHWLKTKRWINKAAKAMKRVEGSKDVRLNAWTFPDAQLQKEFGKPFAFNPL